MECSLARLTFSRMSAAFAVQMDGLGIVVSADVAVDGVDEFLEAAEGAAAESVLGEVAEEPRGHVEP